MIPKRDCRSSLRCMTSRTGSSFIVLPLRTRSRSSVMLICPPPVRRLTIRLLEKTASPEQQKAFAAVKSVKVCGKRLKSISSSRVPSAVRRQRVHQFPSSSCAYRTMPKCSPWREPSHDRVFEACKNCGKYYFIPSASQGLPMSTYPGVYEATVEEINRASRELFPTL